MPQRHEKLTGPMLTRAATLDDNSILDEEERRVRLSFSSEEPYTRSSWFDDPWIETLGHDASEVDMSRLATGGAPLLYNHSSCGRDNHIGVVEKAWIENGRGYADVRLSKRAEVDGVWSDIKDKILTGVSVGYKILERKLTKEGETKKDPNSYRVVRWQPMEISMVPLAADPTVGVGRSEQFVIQELPTEPSEVRKMEDDVIPTAPAAAPVQTDASRAAVVAEERTRQTEIRTLVRAHKLPEDLADKLVNEGSDINGARAAVLETLAKRDSAVEIIGAQRVETGTSGRQRFVEDATAAIMARGGFGKIEGTNSLRSYSLLEIARRSLELEGGRTDGMDKMAIVGRAFTQSTSDFPILLENAMDKVLQNAYTTQSDRWSRFCAVGSVSDFRAHPRYRLGSFGNLDSLNELGEYKNKSIPDGEKSSVSIDTKGNIINLSRKMIIDDDLGAFLGLAAMLGRAARRTIEADVFALLAENAGLGPTMSDNNPLFHNRGTGKNNISTGAALSMTAIDADRVLMAGQKDVSGNDYLDLRPSILLVPTSLLGLARQVNEAEYDDESNKQQRRPNVSRGLFRDIVDTPRLSGTRRYAFADPSEAPVIEVSFLDGNQEPFLDRQDGFTVDGVQLKVRHDYGVGAIDYRGAVTNAGA
jgi:hypothetical protein